MIKIDYDLNRDERKAKYNDYEALCEKCNKILINYSCEDCIKREVDEKEKNRIRFGMCKECSQPNTGGKIWCSHCNPEHIRQDIDKWTSGNEDIDELIKKTQREAKDSYSMIEWIPYDRFTDVKYVAKGGFSVVYSATWTDAYIKGWDHETKNWKRKERKKVALKVLNDSKHISKGFLNEVSKKKEKEKS